VGIAILLAILIGGGGLVHRMARERGRSGAAWTVLHVVAVLSASAVGLWLPALLPKDNLLLVAGSVVASIALPVVAAAAVLVLVTILAPLAARVRGDRFEMYRMSAGERAGETCALAFAPDALTLEGAERERIAWAVIACAQPDHECLRLEWRSTEGPMVALLVPTGESSAVRARAAEGLAKRIEGTLASRVGR